VIPAGRHQMWQSVAVTRPAQQQRGGSTAARTRVPEPRHADADPYPQPYAEPRRADGEPYAESRRTGGEPYAPPYAEPRRVEGEPYAPPYADPRRAESAPPRRDQHAPAGRRTSGEPLRASWDPLAEHAPRLRAARARRRPRRRGLVAFVHTYGWRAYALPVLAVLTALAVFNVDVNRAPTEAAAGPTPSAASSPSSGPGETPTPLVPNPVANPKFDAAKASAELPAGGPFTERGSGTFAVIPGAGPQIGTGQLFTYTVEVEGNVQLPGGPEGFARTVDATLGNPKSWMGSGKYAFQRVDAGTPKIRITLASQETARQLCGFRIPFDSSCFRGGRAVLNAARWERGAVAFQGNVVAYQQYVVNHEVGHALGFGHKPCAENGALAPIMMQQTWGVANDYLAALGTDNSVADGKVCLANPWPYPTAG
jgi:Protein of unknown function (DUF3152)